MRAGRARARAQARLGFDFFRTSDLHFAPMEPHIENQAPKMPAHEVIATTHEGVDVSLGTFGDEGFAGEVRAHYLGEVGDEYTEIRVVPCLLYTSPSPRDS